MRIVIDLQGAQTQSRFRGIGRFSLALSQALVRNRGDHEIVIALSDLFSDTIEPIRAAFEGLLPQENIRVWYAPGPVRERQPENTWRREAAERIREAFLASLKPDVVLVTSLFEGFDDDAVISIGVFDRRTPTVTILHDLIPLLNPDQYLRPNPAYEMHYRRKVEYLKRAYAWLAVSASSAREGAEALGLRKDHMFIISEGCDERFRPIKISIEEKAALFRNYKITRPFILYSGGIEHRKNIHRLIRAYSRLPQDLRKSHQLVLVGGSTHEDVIRNIQSIAMSAGLSSDELIVTGYIPDEDLVKLYNLCKLFVFPSFHEGFGLPPLEAMSCGAPVIAANATSLPEVIGRDDALFDPFSEDAIAAKIEEALADESFCDELRRHGLIQAKKFSWDGGARRTIAALEQVYDERSQGTKVTPSSAPPKLAYISPLPPEKSGISDYSAELLPELAKYYDIEVIVAQQEVSNPWIRKYLPIQSIEYFTKNANRYDRVLYHFGNSSFHQHMFDLLDRFPGVVVLHDFFLGNIYEYMEYTIPGIWSRELYNSHGYNVVWERFHTSNLKEVIFKYPCNFGIIQSALGIIVHSRYSAGLAWQWYGLGEDWSVIPHLRVLSNGSDRAAARRRLGISDDSFLVCSFGISGPIKQNHRLLNAWLSSSLARDSICQLVFVGENDGGDYGRNLIEAINKSGMRDRIRITGWADADTFRDYLQAADIAVQLRTHSRGETSGTVLDCMSFGLPTIVNAHGSLSEIPQDAVYMLPDDFEDSELIEALEMLWRNPELRRALGERAREVISKDHSPRLCAEMYARSIEIFYEGAKLSRYELIDSLARLENMPSDDKTLAAIAMSTARSMPLKRPARQILVDVSAIVQTDLKTGIQRVTRSILKELLLNPPAGYRVEPVYATPSSFGYRYARSFTLNFLDCPQINLGDEPVEAQAGDIFLGLDLHQYVIASQLNYLESMRSDGIRIYFVVYDLLPVLMPDMFPSGTDVFHKKWLESVTGVSDGLIGISKAVASDLSEWLNTNSQKRSRPMQVSWFHIGADIGNSVPTKGLPEDSNRVLSMLSERMSFLMVGTIEPRKGYLQTIAAFEELWREGMDVNLVIVGNEGWKHLTDDDMRCTIPKITNTIRHHPQLGKRLFWLEGISDEYLEKIYAASTCLIAASEGEGFGLPLIEAAQHRLPIIARDIPVFREVAGEHAHYFNGKEPSDLAVAIKRWIELYRSGEQPRSDDMPWLTWKESTERLKNIILTK